MWLDESSRRKAWKPVRISQFLHAVFRHQRTSPPGKSTRTAPGAGRSHKIEARSHTDFPEDPLYVGGEFGLLKSINGGGNWRYLPLPANVLAVAVDPKDSKILYAGTSSPLGPGPSGVFKSVDGGMTWASINAGLPPSLAILLSVDPSNSARLYAGSGGNAVFSIDQVPPTILTVSPASGLITGGMEVTITGANFMEGAGVTIGGVEATDVVVLDTTFIRAKIPAHAPGAADVVVTNPTYQSYRLLRRFTYVPACYLPEAPAISAPSFATAGQLGLSANVPLKAGSTYDWSISNGSITGGQGTGQITFTAQNPGVLVLQVVENSPLACGSAPGAAVVSVASPSGTANSASSLVPIVLDAPGRNGARFSSELTLVNRGTTPATVALVYTPAAALGGFGAGVVTGSLAPGEQRVLPDILEYLRDRGLGIPSGLDGAPQGGTLRVLFSNLSGPNVAYALARTTTPSGDEGRAGLSYAGIGAQGQSESLAVYALRETEADRSNLACLNGSLAGPITLRATLFSGVSGDGRSFLLPDITLGPGQWAQLNSVLRLAGFSNGYARIERVSGSGPFAAYGVINDNLTNDGSYLAAVPASRQAERQHVPVLVETGNFESELILTNARKTPLTVSLSYLESLSPASGIGGIATEVLQPGEQKIISKSLGYLREKGLAIGPRGGSYAGTLGVDFSAEGLPADGFAGARTASPALGGGGYGVFYTGLPLSQTAETEAWVFGLQQGSSTRSNLALSNVGTKGSPLTLRYEVYDGETGRQVGDEGPVTLAPGAWRQVNRVLEPYGLTNGYVRIVRVSGEDRFAAYGVINDGATPGAGTGDGSYVAMTSGR